MQTRKNRFFVKKEWIVWRKKWWDQMMILFGRNAGSNHSTSLYLFLSILLNCFVFVFVNYERWGFLNWSGISSISVWLASWKLQADKKHVFSFILDCALKSVLWMKRTELWKQLLLVLGFGFKTDLFLPFNGSGC